MMGAIGSWHQMVEPVVQGTMDTKCIHTSPGCSRNSSVQRNPKDCEREMRFEIPYVLSEIFCMGMDLTCKQPFQLGRNIWNMHFYLSFSATKTGRLILEPHGTTILTVRNFFQNMVPVQQVLEDVVVWI